VTDPSELPPLGLASIEFVADPHGVAAAHCQHHGAVFDGDFHGWIVLRHADIAPMLRDPAYLKDPRFALAGPYTDVLLSAEPSMLFADDPDHRRLRSLVSGVFTKRATEASRPRIEAIVDELCQAMAEAGAGGNPVDFIAEFAVPFPITVIAEILGIDAADRDDFKRWSDDGALSLDPLLPPEVAARVARSHDELHDYLRAALGERRARPRDDLISALAAVRSDDGSGLSDQEAVSAIALLLLAGNVTTTDLLGNGLLALLRHPEQLAALRDDPALVPNAVEEMLRYDPPVVATDRIATRAQQIDGHEVMPGEWIWPVLTSANRDPQLNVDPDRFDVRRASVTHVSFGGGAHLCLGAPLARLEAQVAIAALITRFPNLRLADAQSTPPYKFVPGFRGLAALSVRVD
jgi:cytochrome P450